MLSAADRAYHYIRRRIVDGALASGAFLVEQDLAKDIGVSRTPVRDALNRLENEGLVRAEGHRRATVRDFTEAEVEECFELRAHFESYAARKAATRMSAEALAKLKRFAAEMDAVVAKGGPDAAFQFSELNTHFHNVILEQAGSARLREIMKPLMQVQLVLMKRFQHTIEAHLVRSCWHHRELVAAFEAKDANWAETQMKTHLLSAKSPG